MMPSDPTPRLRIALVGLGDTADLGYFSGIPARLAAGFAEEGVDVVHIASQMPRLARAIVAMPTLITRQARAFPRRPAPARTTTPVLELGSSAIAQSRLRFTGRLDGVVQFGSELLFSSTVALATFEDITVVQAHRLYPEWQVPARTLAWRIRRQAATYARAAACCTTTSWAGRSICDDYGVAPRKVHVVGVGSDRSAPLASRDWSKPRYLFVGLDWERKNGQLVLDAFSRTRLRHPEAELHIVGRHPPIAAPGVVTHGVLRRDHPNEQRHLDSLFECATCFVLPSQYEPGAVAYVEACSAGLPCIATRVGGSSDLVGTGGKLVDPTSLDELVAAMLHFAQPAAAARIGRAAMRHSAAFTWAAVASRVLHALGLRNVAD
jgi:glycosyltransferase involved in cell wall biosynthesis